MYARKHTRRINTCKVIDVSETKSAPVRSRNARGDGARLRDEIIEAATALLQTGTAESVTLRAVAREARITPPAIYRHFDDLDAVLRAVIDIAFDELAAFLREASAGSSTVVRLRAVCHAYLDFASEHPQRYRLMFGGVWNAAEATAKSPEEFAARGEIGLDAFRVLSNAVDECVRGGESSSEDPFGDAVALWVALHGLAGLRQTTPVFPWPADVEDRLVDALARVGSCRR